MGTTKIEWTEAVWNPVRGCSLVSAGCANCYAMKQAHRFAFKKADVGSDRPGVVEGPYYGLTRMTSSGPVWTGSIKLVPEALDEPLHWRKPRLIFVNSMSDLFHEDVPDEFIAKVFLTMAISPQHTYQILTKRPERMQAWANDESCRALVIEAAGDADWVATKWPCAWPLKNVWLGVSIEDQQTADERIPILLQTPAVVRWVSAEPLLGPVDLEEALPFNKISGGSAAYQDWPDWVVVGGESGPGARPCDIGHIRHIVTQCRDAGVPVFVKQLGSNVYSRNRPMSGQDCIASTRNQFAELTHRKGADMAEWPEDLRVREWPR